MSAESPARPTRRAARRTIVEAESEDELSQIQEDKDEEFTPAPKRSPCKSTTRRQTTNSVSATPKRSARARKFKTGEGIEPTQIFDPEQSGAPSEPPSPTKTTSPRKRKSTSPRKGRRSSVVPPVPALPTPAASASPESEQTQATPLKDITTKALNKNAPPQLQNDFIKETRPTDMGLEKPMDIVIRARSQAVPTVDEPIGSSYAGRQVVGPFHASFSAVVGPNGSGKSNVIDSLLFMRQGKISALIHNSAQHQDLDYCGKHEVVLDSQLVNNSSNYYLNGRTTNFTTVTTLLKDKGIDLDHKRFLILQGEPKAANEHDDGTSKYKTPIEEAAVELERRVQHDKKNKALTFIRDENELAEKQSALYQIYTAECEDNTKQIQEQLNAELEKHAGSEDTIKELEKAYNKALKQYERIEKQAQEFTKELAKYDKENFINGKQKKAEKQATSSRLTASEAQSLVEKHTSDIEKKSAEMKKEEQELGGLSDQIAAKQKSLEPWNAKINQKQSEIAVAQSELDILKEKASTNAKIESIEISRSEKLEEIERHKHDKARLEKDKLAATRQKADEARASLASSQNQGNSGRIDGFHGRLGNLGTIDEKFDVAISTACPVENNLGRANFILLDKLAQRDLSPIQTPENPKDTRFAPAFYSIMQNTLVAQNLEQANRIAYGAKRWRVVTLDGQLIDVSGTMSGGGTRVARGAMSSKLTSDTTKEQVQKLEGERDQLETQQRELEASLREKQEEIPRQETVIQKINLEKRVQDLTAELASTASDDSQIKSLEKQISLMNKELEKLHSETATVEAEIQALQDKIMEKARVDGLKERIDMLNDDISNAELRAKNEKAKDDAEKELDSLLKDLEKLDNDTEKHKTAAAESRDEQKDLDAQTSELNSTRAHEIEMKNKLEENQKKSRYWVEKLSKLSLHDIADLEERPENPGTPDNEQEMPDAPPEADPDAMDVDEQDEPEEQHEPKQEPEVEQSQGRRQLQTFTRDELADMSKDHLVASIAALEEKVSTASGIDLSVISEYRRRCEEVASRTTDLKSAVKTRDTAKARLTDLRNLRLTQFMTGFTTISSHLKSMYQLITLGGNAELELVDSLDPFSEGILFSVMPPKKSWKNIGNLSGGEKTLSSLALVFALHVFRPTPLYVMDEIDAALDFRNVSIVAGYIKERTKNAQFIVISLRNNMFELAERLVGIYKVNHMTKSVTVENRDYLAMGRQRELQQQRQGQVGQGTQQSQGQIR
ncbi:RecF/RecN/SMC [Exophiala viscosa]|uniref:RecF/RecN/SMC n=1 Tax=Exophiala viscosa TaxID=2486360 RepID=UPI002193097C|nr:RecF/RecN/SMC [Exophiala viscosa]